MVLDPLQELLRLDDAGGAEDGGAGHPHVLDPHHGAAGLAQRRAPAVGAGHQGGLGGGERHPEVAVGVLAAHPQRAHDAHRDLGHADEVLAVAVGGPVDVQRVVADVGQRRARHLLQGLAADLRRLLGGEVLGDLVEPALARRPASAPARRGSGVLPWQWLELAILLISRPF